MIAARALRAGALAALMLHASCSWLIVQRPRKHVTPGESPGMCTISPMAPYTDTVLTFAGIGASAGGVAYFFDIDHEGPGETALAVSAIVVPIALTFAFGASGAYGFRHVSRCTKLVDAYLAAEKKRQ